MTLGYICAVCVAVLFMLYFDGQIGVMMLAFLIVMPILSLIVTLWVRRSLTISLQLPDSTAKHKSTTLTLILEKKTVLPMPFLRLKLTADEHFFPIDANAKPLPAEPQPGQGFFSYLRYVKRYKEWRKLIHKLPTPETLYFRCSMGTEKRKKLTIPISGQYCGMGRISVSELMLSDFLAMFRFRMPEIQPVSILILPEIPQLKVSNELFRTVSNEAATADDESDNTPVYSAVSTAGYEHRDYIPGDPLKRINWKLSSKRHRLQVRMDEPVALTKLSVVLDFLRSFDEMPMKEKLKQEERLLESALGLLKLCASQGFPSVLHYPDENSQWVRVSVDSPDQIDSEALTILRGGFRPISEFSCDLLPTAAAQENQAITLYFTSHMDTEKAARLEKLPASSLYVVIPKSDANSVHANLSLPKNASLWYTDKEHNLTPAHR